MSAAVFFVPATCRWSRVLTSVELRFACVVAGAVDVFDVGLLGVLRGCVTPYFAGITLPEFAVFHFG